MEFPTRRTLDYWLPRKLVPWAWLRHLLETSTILAISLLLALLFPDNSANVSYINAQQSCFVLYAVQADLLPVQAFHILAIGIIG